MKNKNLGIISALTIIAITGGSVISYQVFQPETPSTITQETSIGNLEKSLIRGLGDLYLLDYGNEVSAETARTMTGFTNAITPVSIENVVLQSVRIRDYAESQMMTAFYAPSTITLQDLDTFESIMKNNGIIIVFTEENPSSTYNSQKWQEDFVKTAPQVRKSDTINGYPAIVITGNPDKDIKSEVLVYKNNLQIDIVSLKHNVDDLVAIAQLITMD